MNIKMLAEKDNTEETTVPNIATLGNNTEDCLPVAQKEAQ